MISQNVFGFTCHVALISSSDLKMCYTLIKERLHRKTGRKKKKDDVPVSVCVTKRFANKQAVRDSRSKVLWNLVHIICGPLKKSWKSGTPPWCLPKHSGRVLVSPWLIVHTTKLNSLKFAASSFALPAEGSLFCWTCDLCPGGKRPSIYFMALIQGLGQGGSEAKRSAEPTILKSPRGYCEAFPGNPSCGFQAVMVHFA